ncbi:hypothetical protein [Flexibacterium corallicola]|uniref:hypothetical protein n=1 Tax=Flexibacterium corallicola TaxID=3037259 RepID=UPI00286EEE13|nr:hypothetical protein [Pseudovibrio sp. M1P-2-3]
MQQASELQIQIDDVLSCLGSCAGCILTSSERTITSPDMSWDLLEIIQERTKNYLEDLEKLNRINITFGIADHVLMGADYIAKLHKVGSDIITTGCPSDIEHSAVFFSTSLVAKPSKVLETLRQVHHSISGPISLIPLVVLDGRITKSIKFGPRWKSMVHEAKRLFGKVDLSINLSSSGCCDITPHELIAFAKDYNFSELTVNWAPSLSNAHETIDNIEVINDWIMEFDTLAQGVEWITTSYRPVIEKTINALKCNGSVSSGQVIKDMMESTIRHSLQFDSFGNLMPKLEAVGDITHAPRHGLKVMGNIQHNSISEILQQGIGAVERSAMKIHARGCCGSCEYSPICAGTGFHVATNVVRNTGKYRHKDKCPHLAYNLIRRINSGMQESK